MDVHMAKVEDLNHVVELYIGDDTQPYVLVPDTHMNEVNVIQEGCKGCWNKNEHYYTPSGDELSEQQSESTVNYFFMLHQFDRIIRGNHFMERVCVQAQKDDKRCVD